MAGSHSRYGILTRALRAALFALAFVAGSAPAQEGGATAGNANSGAAANQTAPAPTDSPVITNQQPVTPAAPGPAPQQAQPGAPERAPEPAQLERPESNEFQDFVAASVGRQLPIFGQDLFRGVPSTFAPLDRVPVPADYTVGPGDEILIRAWGQIDVDLRLVVDREGMINIPRVGIVNVAGIRHQDLTAYLKNAIGRVFRNFDLSVTLGQLRSVQVFVVGQARRPGTYTVSSLSTLVNTVFASGGPSSRGSMRRIELKRGAKVVTEFDLYDLLVKGDKSRDHQLQPGDVIYIPPVGPLAAISGSVNQSAIFELKGGETLDDLLQYAGGLTTTAAGQKVIVERIEERKARLVAEFGLDSAGRQRALRDGDLVRVFALTPRFENAVTLRGAIANPGRYPWKEGMRVRDLIPTREALIVPEYWARVNATVREDIRSQAELRSAVAKIFPEPNWEYAAIERLNYDALTTSLIPFNLGKAVLQGDQEQNLPLKPGDIVTIFSADDIQIPVAARSIYVRLEGEVRAPGVYQAQPGETLRQLLARVGGFTPDAYVYAAEFTREAVRARQQKRLDEFIQELSLEVERTVNASAVSKDEAETARVRASSQQRLVEKLAKIKATGRVVLELYPDRIQLKDIPDIVLEDGDRLIVPSRPSTINVVGAVYNSNALLFKPDKRIEDYLNLAGGPTKDADSGSIYVVRADGTVISKRQSSWVMGFNGELLMPGDAIFVPENLDKYRFTREVKDWTQIFYNFALGVAAIKVLQDL